MKIEVMKIEDLKPAPYNPRIELVPGMEEYEKLKRSIIEFGFVETPVFNEYTGCIVGGHQRITVAKALGYDKIEVSVVNISDIAKEKSLNIALNKVNGLWNDGKLTELLGSLESEYFDLTGFEVDELESLISSFDEVELLVDKVKKNPIDSNLFDTFLFPPFSYLDTKSKRWQDRKNQWKSLGIKSEVGREENLTFNKGLNSGGLNGTSIFDPVLCELVYRWFTPNVDSKILDPFAGGSVRGVIASVLGHKYTGIDLRKEQVSANCDNAKEIGLENIKWITDDSLNLDNHIEDESKDLLFTCPPYFDLEVYSDNPEDISNMNYDDFSEIYVEILRKGVRKLKKNRFAIVVISDVRDTKTGFYRDLTGLTKQAFESEGAHFYNDLILLNVAGTGALRARLGMNNRKVVRMHQNVLVFYKGNSNEITKYFPVLETLDENLENLVKNLDI